MIFQLILFMVRIFHINMANQRLIWSSQLLSHMWEWGLKFSPFLGLLVSFTHALGLGGQVWISLCWLLEEFSAIRVCSCHCVGEVSKFLQFHVINALLWIYLFILKIYCLVKTLREEHKVLPPLTILFHP